MSNEASYQDLVQRIKELEKMADRCRICEEALIEQERNFRTLQEKVPIGLFKL